VIQALLLLLQVHYTPLTGLIEAIFDKWSPARRGNNPALLEELPTRYPLAA
jgi:hypothetical protein